MYCIFSYLHSFSAMFFVYPIYYFTFQTTDMLTAKAHNAREIAVEAAAKGDAAYQSVLDIKKSLEGG